MTIEELESEVARLRKRCERERKARDEAEMIGERTTRELHDSVVRLTALTHSLSAPLLEIRRGLIVVPLVGIIDRERVAELSATLLPGIRARRAKSVVIDVTGVPEIDEATANALIQTAEAARLLGARVIVTGISAVVAQRLTELGVSALRIETAGDLASGIDASSSS